MRNIFFLVSNYEIIIEKQIQISWHMHNVSYFIMWYHGGLGVNLMHSEHHCLYSIICLFVLEVCIHVIDSQLRLVHSMHDSNIKEVARAK